jgi:mono/diheme cytochrome c family protein
VLTSLEIKGALAAVTTSALLLTGTFTVAGVYRAYRRAGHGAWEPGASQSVTARGRSLFLQSCAHCHGQDADGGEDAPSLRKLQISGSHMTLVIRSGIKGEMQSFSKKYSDQDTAALVAYLKTLN